MNDNKNQRRDDRRAGETLDWEDAPPAGTTQHVKHGDVPTIEFTLSQAEALVHAFGGYDAEVSVMERPAAWVNMDPGLYAYFTEYPDEGSIYLGPTEVDDDLAMNGRAPAAPVKTWRERIGQPPEYPLHAPTDVERAMEAEIAELRSQLARQGQGAPGAAHADDLAVDRFASAMKAKMAQKRAEGRGGWDDKAACSAGRLQIMLVEHLAKGDPLDIGNFAMMLWNRGEPVAALTQTFPNNGREPDWAAYAAAEAAELLDSLIASIERDGNYSKETTLTFLNQIRQCIVTAVSPADAKGKDDDAIAGGQKPVYGPDNPPRLRMPGESVQDYRIAMGWDQPTSDAANANGGEA